MYLQALLSQALRALGHAREAENSIHFSYEMVALSHATARELGYESASEGVDPQESAETQGRRSRSSRCRVEKASASKSTICSTC